MNTEDLLYKTIFTVLFYTGLRLGETRALTWGDYTGSSIVVKKSINTRIKKHIGESLITSPKTKKSVRQVPLPEYAIDMLDKYFEHCKLKLGFETNWFIFGDVEPISETTLRRKIQHYSKLSGLHYVSPHGFRHSYTTLLYNLKVPDEIARETLGHESIETTRNIYTHISQNTINDTINESFKKLDK